MDLFHILKSLGGKQSAERIQRAKQSGHYEKGIFVNTVPTKTVQGSDILTMLKKQIFGKEQRVPPAPVPTQTPTSSELLAKNESSLRAVWIGHASVLVEIDGHFVLTDPVWSDRCSPSRLMGPKRFFKPPFSLKDLPKLDAIVISHDHYDHLDMDTITELAKRDVKIIVPLGVGAHLEHWKIPANQIVELNWNETFKVRELEITVTPARHFSGRSLSDRNKTFWASFVLKAPHHKVFYSGDSGYFGEYKTIGDTHGPFDLTLMQIGACSRYWPDIHMMPEDAMQAHLDLRGKVLLPVHWGTFNLAFHAWNDPAVHILNSAKDRGARVTIPKPGQMIDLSETDVLEPWWEMGTKS